ncbi:TetR/AcrR family transcriptional regulator [Flavobacterium alkalisoli]|uniref:TetR/AcrR family transcriptional regulator n=1 Tax=Flavobacterium alkalisoli TaxID=2602769 RepID=A0A5B9FWT7_9FLAO|nr:TetR/AcrR family transcriptional regulator [Flavobacterium alkalisoli]QEE50749.1 TetR/AcrR family transcriptional regulator [Flavobacterium alkalisoli]
MRVVLSNVKLIINENVYVKDPESSALGKKILNESILLIDEMGFEAFTFKKLGQKIESNESSIYRYFENKHKLLIYLTSWYWSWMEYRLVFETANLESANERLKKAILLFTEEIEDDLSTEHINESVLQRIIISDFTKTILTKEVDLENRNGFFLIYKRVIHRISQLIKEVNSNYPYPDSLASSIIEGALHQHFLKQHLKSITNCDDLITPADFYMDMINKVLN